MNRSLKEEKETRTMLLPMMRERLLTALAGTPDVLDGLLRPLGPNDALWDMRPDPDRFTLREALAHLVDYETVWRERLCRTRDEERPELPPVDRDRLALDNHYAQSDPAASRAAFRRQRSDLVDALRELSPEDWQRVGHRAGPGGGPLILEEQAAFILSIPRMNPVGFDAIHAGQPCNGRIHRRA